MSTASTLSLTSPRPLTPAFSDVSADDRFGVAVAPVLLPQFAGEESRARPLPGWALAAAWIEDALGDGDSGVKQGTLSAAALWLNYLEREIPKIPPGRMTPLEEGGLHIGFCSGPFHFQLELDEVGDGFYELFMLGELVASEALARLPEQASLLRFLANGTREARQLHPTG